MPAVVGADHRWLSLVLAARLLFSYLSLGTASSTKSSEHSVFILGRWNLLREGPSSSWELSTEGGMREGGGECVFPQGECAYQQQHCPQAGVASLFYVPLHAMI